MNQSERVTLYYREGSSDKVYQAAIEPKGDGFVMNFAYGRRGATLQTGTKTSSPVPFAAAKKIYDRVVGEKMAKGYTPGADGTPYQSSDNADRVTGILPQLLNPIEESEADLLIRDSVHCAQERYDGRRGMIQKSGGDVVGINRKGLTIALPQSLATAAQALSQGFVIDGESIGDTFFAFDLLELDGSDLRQMPYSSRYQSLAKLLAKAPKCFVVAESATTATEKEALLKRLRRENKEGIVFKRLDAPYKPGRPASGGSQLKHKFYATLSAVVSGVNAQRSVEISLCNGKGRVPAGNVTIPPNHQIPTVGDVVEVRYLYAFRESGCIYQPTYLGKRTDVDAKECTTTQLKFKAEGDDEG